MNTGNPKLMAYVDGELDRTEATEFETRMATDAALRRAVHDQRRLRQLLSDAYDPVLQEPVPPTLQAMLAAPAPVFSLGAARQRRDTSARHWRAPEWLAMAACLVLGVALGVSMGMGWFGSRGPNGPADTALLAQAADGRLRAQGALDKQLTQALAAEPAAGVAVGLSFQARDGRYCRSFALEGAAALAGLACRDEAGWAVQGLAPAGTDARAAAGSYRTAATALPPTLLQLVDSLRAGDTLDAAAERAARDAGWKAPAR